MNNFLKLSSLALVICAGCTGKDRQMEGRVQKLEAQVAELQANLATSANLIQSNVDLIAALEYDARVANTNWVNLQVELMKNNLAIAQLQESVESITNGLQSARKPKR